MKFSKNKINEYMNLYLNDLSDYGDEGEYKITESILNSFKTTLDESENDFSNLLKEITKNSPEHKQTMTGFLEYIKEISGNDNNIKINNVNYYQQLLDMNRYSLSQRKYLQGIINFAKKQNGLVTPKQFDILQRLKSGDFNYGKK
jgi:hypothetical protein